MALKRKVRRARVPSTRKIGRDARTGEFIPVRIAQRRKRTAIVETIQARPRRKR